MQFQKRVKKRGHQAHLQENDDFINSLASSGHKEKPPFFNVHMLVTHEIIYSKDVQCKTTDDVKL